MVIRHAKSDWSKAAADRQRPLASRGRRQAALVGRWLAERDEVPAHVILSSARRAQETWELIAAELEAQGRDVSAIEVITDESVYASSGDDLLDVVRGLPPGLERAAIVGHNPAMEECVQALTGAFVTMKTSALAVVEVAGWASLRPGEGRLRWAGRPAETYS